MELAELHHLTEKVVLVADPVIEYLAAGVAASE